MLELFIGKIELKPVCGILVEVSSVGISVHEHPVGECAMMGMPLEPAIILLKLESGLGSIYLLR